MTNPPSFAAPHGSPALRSFDALWRGRAASQHDDPLWNQREQAMKRVLALGLPSARDETWRYTNLRHLSARGFVEAPRNAPGGIEPGRLAAFLGRGARVHNLVLVNGRMTRESLETLANSGLEINSLDELSRSNPASLAAHLPEVSDADEARWGLVNLALFQDGLFVRVRQPVTAPLVVSHLLVSQGANNIAHPRVIIDAAPDSRATVIEHFIALGPPPLCNSATHMVLRRNSEIEHYRIFSTDSGAEHIDTLTIGQERDSRCRQFTFALGGDLVRTTLQSRLNQPGASMRSFSMLMGHESRHVDCVNVVTHAAPDTESVQTSRAIASGASRVVFNSKVVVDPGAARAASQQSCRGLLLSLNAEIDTRPQLEIHADEVKCAHGATTGRLDPNMLFYLLSRGMPRHAAQSLLVFAFLSDVLTHMSIPGARSAVEDALIAQLPDPQLLKQFR